MRVVRVRRTITIDSVYSGVTEEQALEADRAGPIFGGSIFDVHREASTMYESSDDEPVCECGHVEDEHEEPGIDSQSPNATACLVDGCGCLMWSPPWEGNDG